MSAIDDRQRLSVVRWVHTVIYVVMAMSVVALLYAGIVGAQGTWLWVASFLLGSETIVFVGSGARCPLTTLAVRYGAERGHAFETFLPERVARHTFRFFGSIMVVGLLLLFLRWLDVIR